MIVSRRSALAGIAFALSAAACSASSTSSPPTGGTALEGANAASTSPALPIEQQIGTGARLPVEAEFAGTAGDADSATSVAPLSAELAAEHVIPVVTSRAPVLRRRLPPKRLLIPRLGIDAKVVSLGTKLDAAGALVWETAAFAVGHHRGTANPGENGNMVLSGHISSRTEGDVFHRLPEIEPGDGIVVETDEQPFLYVVVEKVVVEPQDVRVMEVGQRPICTLITCVPDGVYTHRLIVSGTLV